MHRFVNLDSFAKEPCLLAKNVKIYQQINFFQKLQVSTV